MSTCQFSHVFVNLIFWLIIKNPISSWSTYRIF
jgi:hypothetical protein